MGQPVNPQSDHIHDICFGRCPHERVVQFFGYSPNTSATPSNYTVNERGAATTPLTSAQSIEIVSSSANDTSAGTGARTVYVEGVDGNYVTIFETVTMNGTSAVQLTKQYLAINYVNVMTAGSNKRNVGNLTVQVSGGGTVVNYVAANAGVSRTARHVIPAGNSLRVMQVMLLANKVGSPTASATIEGWQISPAGVIWSFLPLTICNAEVINVPQESLIVIPEKTTVEFVITSTSVAGLDISTWVTGIQSSNISR